MKDHSWYICWSKSYHLLIISNWNIRENFSPRLVAPGRLWSPWEAPSSPHLAPGDYLEGQPPEDRLAMILKKKTFSWSRQEPSFQLIKTITKFSADQNLDQIFNSDLVQSPLFHNVPAGKLHLHILTISPRGVYQKLFCRSCLIFPSTFFQFNCKL